MEKKLLMYGESNIPGCIKRQEKRSRDIIDQYDTEQSVQSNSANTVGNFNYDHLNVLIFLKNSLTDINCTSSTSSSSASEEDIYLTKKKQS